MTKYILGVDGGNSKTDFLLYDTTGNYVDTLRGGSCSHEKLGYEGAKRELGKNIQTLLKRNNVTVEQITAAAFGLAGIDMPYQQEGMQRQIRELGFDKFVAVNDSFLGIKASCEKGYGVCSINGTGTVAGGIDMDGTWLQVGGTGSTFGDEAGGSIIARSTVRAVYDAFFRCGKETLLCDKLMNLMQVQNKYLFMETSIRYLSEEKDAFLHIMNCLFDASKENDKVAIRILEHTGSQLAYSAGGCINNLRFEQEVDVVLMGSVWIKAATPIMRDIFKEEIAKVTSKICHIKPFQGLPAAGAILWAMELFLNTVPPQDLREKILVSLP